MWVWKVTTNFQSILLVIVHGLEIVHIHFIFPEQAFEQSILVMHYVSRHTHTVAPDLCFNV